MKKLNAFALLTFSSKENFGVIAQELEEVFPQLVNNLTVIEKKDDLDDKRNFKNYKGVDYTQLIPILIQGFKELDYKIEALDEQGSLKMIEELKRKISDLESNLNNVAIKSNTSEPENSLMKAYPNPSSSEMTIEFENINKNFTVFITDLTGKLIKNLDLRGGTNNIRLSSEEFNNGIYQCNLIIDGEVITSKKIIFNK